MLVRRLQHWLSSNFSRLFSRRRGHAVERAERQAVLAGACSQSASVAAHAAGNWLDDGRRLRPRAPGPEQSFPNPTRRAPPTGDTPGWSPKASRPRVAPGKTDSTTAPPADAPTPQPPAIVPPAIVPPTQPLIASVSFEVTADEGDTQMRRGLASLKYLVQLGIYNEGFKGGQVPEQYQRSLGMDDSAQDE